MSKPIRSILFATDLTPNCQQALEYTIAIATRFAATIYMLHVIERLPDNERDRLKNLLGKHQWDELVNSRQETGHKSLLGKQSTGAEVRQALRDFCKLEGIQDSSCDFHSSEIIVTDGDIIGDILQNAEKNECDLIVLGGYRNIFGRTHIGSTIKEVLENSSVPVTIVPATKNKEL